MRLTPTTTSTYRVIPRAEPCGHIPLMARSSMLCGMGDRMKHTCTIGISIPPITSESIDSAAFAIRCASSGSFRTRGGDMFPLSTKTVDIRTNKLEVTRKQKRDSNSHADRGIPTPAIREGGMNCNYRYRLERLPARWIASSGLPERVIGARGSIADPRNSLIKITGSSALMQMKR